MTTPPTDDAIPGRTTLLIFHVARVTFASAIRQEKMVEKLASLKA
jgi:hypothetical protein